MRFSFASELRPVETPRSPALAQWTYSDKRSDSVIRRAIETKTFF